MSAGQSQGTTSEQQSCATRTGNGRSQQRIRSWYRQYVPPAEQFLEGHQLLRRHRNLRPNVYRTRERSDLDVGYNSMRFSVSTTTTWAENSNRIVQRSQSERAKTSQMKSDVDNMINMVSSQIWDAWSNTNNALARRAAETLEAKSKLQMHLHKVISVKCAPALLENGKVVLLIVFNTTCTYQFRKLIELRKRATTNVDDFPIFANANMHLQ